MKFSALLIALLLLVGAIGTAGAQERENKLDRLFISWAQPPAGDTSCGDDRFLSERPGDDVNCSALLLPQGIQYDFPTKGLDAFQLDATTNITGFLGLEPVLGATYGVGVADVTIRITATETGSFIPLTLGSQTEQVILSPATGDASITWDFDVPDEFDGKTLTGMTLSYIVEGTQVSPYDYNLDGNSFMDYSFIVPQEDPAV